MRIFFKFILYLSKDKILFIIFTLKYFYSLKIIITNAHNLFLIFLKKSIISIKYPIIPSGRYNSYDFLLYISAVINNHISLLSGYSTVHSIQHYRYDKDFLQIEVTVLNINSGKNLKHSTDKKIYTLF